MEQQHSDQAALIQQIAETIIQRGWRTPALALLEAGRPLAFLGGQLLWLSQPLFASLLPAIRWREFAHLLEDSAAVEALIGQLERG